jgi:hypothetical protein
MRAFILFSHLRNCSASWFVTIRVQDTQRVTEEIIRLKHISTALNVYSCTHANGSRNPSRDQIGHPVHGRRLRIQKMPVDGLEISCKNIRFLVRRMIAPIPHYPVALLLLGFGCHQSAPAHLYTYMYIHGGPSTSTRLACKTFGMAALNRRNKSALPSIHVHVSHAWQHGPCIHDTFGSKPKRSQCVAILAIFGFSGHAFLK